jgi:hypothetical protein
VLPYSGESRADSKQADVAGQVRGAVFSRRPARQTFRRSSDLNVRGLLSRPSILPVALLGAASLLLPIGNSAFRDLEAGTSRPTPSEMGAYQSFLVNHPWSSGATGADALVLANLLSPWPDAPQLLLPAGSAFSRDANAANRWFSPLAPPQLSSRPVLLLSPSADLPQDLLPLVTPSPAKICEGLAAAGFPNSGWKMSEILANQWECYSKSEDHPISAAPAPFSVFFILRGSEGGLTEMRMKVSLRDPTAADALSKRTAAFLGLFSAHAGMQFPPVFIKAVVTRRWAQYVSETAVFTVAMEYGTEMRYNVTAVFNRSEGKFLQLSKDAMDSAEWRGIRSH